MTTTLVSLEPLATIDVLVTRAVPSVLDDSLIDVLALDGEPAVRLTVTLLLPVGITPGLSPPVTLNLTVPAVFLDQTFR